MFRRTLAWLLPTGLIALFSAAFLHQTRGYALLGWDAYPIVLTSRVESLGGLFATFGDRLMDGRYAGAFYRPLFELTIALDYALWGLEPFGYQLTNVLWLAAAAAALYLLARRLTGDASLLGPTTTLVVFFMSSYQWEVLPVAPRRPELMSVTFMAWLLAREASHSRRSPWIGWAIAAAAMLSKETAFVLPGLVAVLHFSIAVGGWRDRLRVSWRPALPYVGVAALLLAVRIAVLGGIGGPEAHGGVPSLLASLRYTWKMTVLPQTASDPQSGSLAALAFLAVSAFIFWWLRPRSPRASTTLLPLAWILAPALLYSMGTIDGWYLWGAMCGWSVLSGVAAAALYDRMGEASGIRFYVAASAFAILVFLLGWQSISTPLIRHSSSWERGSAALASFLAESELRLENEAPGSVIEAPPMPMTTANVPGEPHQIASQVINHYSVQAWAELRFPDCKILVVAAEPTEQVTPSPDVLQYVIRFRSKP